MRQQHRLAGALDVERLLRHRTLRHRRTDWSARRTSRAAAGATTPTATTGCRRSSAGSRSSPAGASQRCHQFLDNERIDVIRRAAARRGRGDAPPTRRGRAASRRRARGTRSRQRRHVGVAGAGRRCRARPTRCDAPIADRDRPRTNAPTAARPRASSASSISISDTHGSMSVAGAAMLRRESHRRRADRLAVVAPVDAIADRCPPSSVHHAGLLDDPRQAAARIDHARSDDRARRAGVDAPAARSAAVGHRRRARVGSGRRGDDATEHEPTARARQQDVGVLAEPTDAGSIGDLAIDDGVVVGEHHGSPAVAAQLSGDRAQPFAQRHVVVGPCIPSDPSLRARWRGRLVGVVRACADEHRSRTGNSTLRVGRALWVLVGELQPVVQSGVLAADQLGSGSLEYLGVAHTDVRDVVLRRRSRRVAARTRRQQKAATASVSL